MFTLGDYRHVQRSRVHLDNHTLHGKKFYEFIYSIPKM